ncbi:hypothetical protein [Streptomyces sp. NBC_01808]
MVKTGTAAAVVKAKLRDPRTGKVLQTTYESGQEVKLADFADH